MGTATWIALGLATPVTLIALLLVVARERGGPLPGVSALFEFLKEEAFILLFATMAGGYALGKVAVKGISLGPTAGSLVVGIGLSTWASGRHGVAFELPDLREHALLQPVHVRYRDEGRAAVSRRPASRCEELPDPLGSGAPRRRGPRDRPQAVARPRPGVAAGIFAGSNTATPGLAAANAAFASGVVQLPPGESQAEAIQDLSTAFACSYCVSAVLFVVFLKILPQVFGRDARAEARDFERQVTSGGAALPGAAAGFWPGTLPVQQRTYRIEEPWAIGRSIAELRTEQPLYLVDHLSRAGESVPVSAELVLERGDLISIFARVPLLLEAEARFGPELYQADAPQRELETVEVVQKNAAVVGLTLSDMVKDLGHGLYLNAMFRAGDEVPARPRRRHPAGRRAARDGVAGAHRAAGTRAWPGGATEPLHRPPDAGARALHRSPGRRDHDPDRQDRVHARLARAAAHGHRLQHAAHEKPRARRPVSGAGAPAARRSRPQRVRGGVGSELGRRSDARGRGGRSLPGALCDARRESRCPRSWRGWSACTCSR